MKQAGELELILSQTVAATDKPDFYLNIPYSEPLKIKFNRHYFATMKLLVSALTQQYHKEKTAFFVNHKLLKFIEFGQKFLNYFCVQATFYLENLNQNSFELSLFYIAYSNLAHQFKFNDLLTALKKLQISIIHEFKTSALINTDVNDFHVRFSGEITGFENCLQAIYPNYVNGKYKNDLIIDYEKHQQFIFDIMKSNLHVLQRQFCIKLMQFHYLNPLLISEQTSNIVDNLLRPEVYVDERFGELDINVADELFGPIARRNNQEHFANTRHEYEERLLWLLHKILPKNDDRPVIIPIKVMSEKDLHDLQFNYIIFTHIYFSKVKLHKEIRACVFMHCVFNEDIFKDTQYHKCIFYNCSFIGLTIHGVLKACEFIYCNFKAASFEWLVLSKSEFKQCSLKNTDWYEVDAEGISIENSSLVDASIRFSNFNQASLTRVNFTNARFEGTNVKLSSSAICNWTNTNFDDALFLSDAHRVFREHLLANINDWLVRLFQDPQRCQNILISSGDITTKLNQIINDETPVNQINYKERFRQLLGWILCATSRLNSFCDLYDKEKNSFIYGTSLNVMETLAEITKLAINLLNNSYLTLYDRCHLSSMTRNMLNNSIFSYQQYQDVMHKKWAPRKIYLDPYFANNEKNLNLEAHSENALVETKFLKRESLLAIQQLPTRFKNIDGLLLEMRSKLQNNQSLTVENPRLGR